MIHENHSELHLIDPWVHQDYKKMWYSIKQEKMDEIHNIAEAIIAKHRHGPISKVKLHFNASSTKFSDFIDINNPSGHQT